MDVGETAYEFENRKSVVLVIGVNGVGKTTSVGKLAGKLKDKGKKVVLAAADTFQCGGRGTADRVGKTSGCRYHQRAGRFRSGIRCIRCDLRGESAKCRCAAD